MKRIIYAAYLFSSALACADMQSVQKNTLFSYADWVEVLETRHGQEDFIVLNDGKKLYGNLESTPSLEYPFGTLSLELNEISAIAISKQEDKLRLQYVTRNGQNFVGIEPRGKFKIKLPYQDGLNSQQKITREIEPSDISFMILKKRDYKQKERPRQLFSLELKNGSQLPVLVVNQPITLSNGWKDRTLHPSDILEINLDGGLHGSVLENGIPQDLGFYFVKDKYLTIQIPQLNQMVKMPWEQIISLQANNNGFKQENSSKKTLSAKLHSSGSIEDEDEYDLLLKAGITTQAPDQIGYTEGDKIQILAPIEIRKNEKFEEVINRLRRQGYLRIRLNGEYLELDTGEIPFDKKRKNELFLVIDRLKVNPSIQHRLYEGVENASHLGNGKLTIVRNDKDIPFNLSFAVESTGKSYPEITPHTFAFNTAEGMCMDCLGLGYQYGANLMQKPEIMEHSFFGLLRVLWREKHSAPAFHLVQIFLDAEGIDPLLPLHEMPVKHLQLLLNGSPEDKWYDSTKGFRFRWPGINQVFAKAAKSAAGKVKDAVIPLLNEMECLSCEGSRLNPLARHVTINQLTISDLCRLPIGKALEFVQHLKLTGQDTKLLEEVKRQLISRLSFLANVGLHYIALERRAPTLSGGEAQRIRLARQLGSGLTGVLYVLDEPTIGLHPRDGERLNRALRQLKDLGNTMLMVEHDPMSIQTADYILDFGPQSGEHGGHIVAKGTLKQLMRNSKSLTGGYLSGKLTVPMPETRRQPGKGWIVLNKATTHNLKNVTVRIPVGTLTCLTGVSGSGKSTLMLQVLQPAIEKGIWNRSSSEVQDGCLVEGIAHFDKLLSIDQNPIGLTARSDVGTYVDVLSRMREFFASLPLAKAKGLQPKHFSYNHRRGMCTACWGMGYKKVEMHFLPDVKVVCEDCQGLRLNPVSLEVVYNGKNFGQYLEFTVDEARQIFANHPRIVRILDTLIAVGLGYLKLGQEMASLSGGEAQRIKLSRELAKRSTGKTLYLLDEPTTGLHSEDIKKLLKVLHKLVDKGNTVVVIEHNLDMIKNADYIIDLGPDAGEQGGELVFEGTPEEIVNSQASITGKYLRAFFN